MCSTVLPPLAIAASCHLIPCGHVAVLTFAGHAAVAGAGFVARDLTIRNTAGPAAHQAVALHVDSDRSAFFRVAVEGHQDTVYQRTCEESAMSIIFTGVLKEI